MKRLVLVVVLCAVAVAGFALAQLFCNSIRCRDAIGKAFGRGHLVALIKPGKIFSTRGIYQLDLDREYWELGYVNGDQVVDPAFAGSPAGGLAEQEIRRTLLTSLVANATVRELASSESVSKSAIERQTDLIQFQFPNSQRWLKALTASHLSRGVLASEIARNLRAEKWIAEKLAAALTVSDSECAEYFNAHRDEYSLPARYRASHLFLAAPEGTPASIVDEKCAAIESLYDRVSHGERFTDLVAQASEDKATKMGGGDLGYFSRYRMPPDFFAVVAQMHIGEITPPIQTRLGLHIVQLTDFKPARQMSFAEARDEIRLKLENEKRLAATRELTITFAAKAEFMPASGVQRELKFQH